MVKKNCLKGSYVHVQVMSEEENAIAKKAQHMVLVNFEQLTVPQL